MHPAKPARVFILLFMFALAAACSDSDNPAPQWKTLNGEQPLVIGHRGASGYMPDHTLESYLKAIELGADFIEPDLVSTKDGVLIARHEVNLIATTDVATRGEFASRNKRKIIDGVNEDGFFAEDFTLAEIKTLRAIQPLAERDQSHNGKYLVPTLQEVVDLVKSESQKRGRAIGIYPETKHPTYHQSIGLPLEDKLVTLLHAAGFNTKDAPVIIQSFEVSNLKYLRTKTQLKLVQLIDADDVKLDGSISLAPPYDKPYDFRVANNPKTFVDMMTPAGLDEIATYADGIGPWKPYLISSKGTDRNGDGKADDMNNDGVVDERDRTLLPPSNVVEEAHKRKLLVHPFTFRNEARRLTGDYAGDPIAEYKRFFDLGVDGVFSDFTDTAVAARRR
jgi:glycerophosphoryl diester phosphodiesterase